MEDEVKTGAENEVIYDDDNDPEWDNVKWTADSEDGEPEKDDIDDSEEGEADHSEAEAPAETKDGPTEDEAKVLAQKGLDYDNIRSERDNFRNERDTLKTENERLKEMEAFLNEVRGDQFSSIDDFMLDTRARMIAEKNGTKFEDELASLKAKQAPKPKEEHKEPEKPSPVDEFVRRFPEVKAEEIPESVWAEVRQTGDLVGAYVRHMESKKADEIQKLKDEIEILKQNAENAKRSAGSSRSAGNKSNKSTIAELWDNGE